MSYCIIIIVVIVLCGCVVAWVVGVNVFPDIEGIVLFVVLIFCHHCSLSLLAVLLWEPLLSSLSFFDIWSCLWSCRVGLKVVVVVVVLFIIVASIVIVVVVIAVASGGIVHEVDIATLHCTW